jgi:hypothetical protein
MKTMKTRALLFAAVLAVPAWGGAVHAQYAPPPPPPDQPPGDQGPGAYNDQPPPPPPGNPGPGYDNQDPGNYPPPPGQGYDSQQPYYDPQPDGNYQAPGTDPGYAPDVYGPQGPTDESVFYGELSPYGRWMQRGSYGWVWEPTRVAVGWRPYTQGHWVDTDQGWTWISDEPWGWATYHYGRWLNDPEYGWLWVPGTDWAPAWVSFQEGGGYVGWAPLPPSVGFRFGVGLQLGGLSLSAEIDPYAYSFVPERAFLQDRIAEVILPPARNVTFIRSTTNITNIVEVNNRVVNRGIPVQRIEQATGQQVRLYQLNASRNPTPGRLAQIQGNQVSIFRPAANLSQARPSVTPQTVIQRRQQRLQTAQAPGAPQQARPGQPARPVQGAQAPGGQPRYPSQPGYQQPQPGSSRPAPTSMADLQRKHQAEQQQLQARQDAERSRLSQLQEREKSDPQVQAQGKGQEVAAQHQAEQRALQQQPQREQQLLTARHQREQQAVQARPQPKAQPQEQRDRDRKPPV